MLVWVGPPDWLDVALPPQAVTLGQRAAHSVILVFHDFFPPKVVFYLLKKSNIDS